MDLILWLMAALGACFFVYLLYTGQFKWLLGVVRNMALGIVGMLGLNALLSGIGLTVGVNAITAIVVGLLGIPGFLFLYAARLLVG
ncbi:MAG: pro-sigmaK processing inhibitor BofA family protein [Firmicutes bacterium]|nr:pro-sigmaK processing inhibitor BofA family protein [Bacillota bacterium]